ncbi:hypothetical protein CfE428DRAFT_3795 [Chthoniobacter flavus Ellin428]|uniref:DUF7305 domain-containing protein n=1 Tax=Chthoniobacter flavus Ellin428 TaxID=497964 RepID=B4D4F7_9BACT|nr:hypothetical protein [Chthoniobacter flavus]EDY18758.1 hypothetical protein CfE428DRAFT_3795 [Chthoniobacter flavus Ellin428]TCO89002.1 hypothetical protein EV701_11536 [Chthoniobacter flavus]
MHRASAQSGSTIVLALVFVGILLGIGSVTISVLQSRYRQVHQNASWEEALLTAEAGIDIAVNEMRKELYDPTNAWSGWSNSPDATSAATPDPTTGSAYYTSKVFVRETEGGQRSYAKIAVDAPSFLRDATGEQWYRIRSLGVAEVPGGAVVAGDKLDLELRKFDLNVDHRSGERVFRPQATRLIEAIVKPVGTFRLALFGGQTISLNNHNVVVDSYDSRDPAKSTNGVYDPAKRQQNGNIATNGTLIDAGGAHVYGSAATNGGTVLDATNVTGDVRDDFYQELFAVNRPNVTPDVGTPTYVSSSTTLDAKAGDPAQFLLGNVQLSGQDTLRIRGAADGSPTYAQIVVTGDVSTSGQASIQLDPGVNLRIFVAGNVNITGNGILNPNSALNLQVYGIDRGTNADGSPQNPGTVTIAGNGGFSGTVYAPTYNVTMTGGGNTDNIYGAFIGWTVTMTGIQAVHYDEALGDGGLISDYKVVSWFEDAR